MESLKSACRVCLQYDSDSNSFLDEVEYEENIKLANVFQKVTDIEVSDTDDKRPCRLCQECTERLLSSYDFICCVEKAENEIENYLKSEKDHYLVDGEIHKLDEDNFHVNATDIDIEDIEILEEEFQIDNEPSWEKSEEVIDDYSNIVVQSDCHHNQNTSYGNETRRCNEPVGSRLSKRLSSSNYKCSICQRTFAKLETMERHKKVAHTVIPPEELAIISSQACATIPKTEDKKKIKCSYCPQVFKRRNNYMRHMTASHLKEVEQLADEDKELFKTKRKYKRGNCPHCGKNFTQASLIVHIRRHTGENPYQCDQCVKAFPRRQDLVLHQRKHTGERPHVCTICGKSFSRPNKLARHMRVHTGERPYKCTLCQRSFAQSNDLKIHMRRHTGEKPYKCGVCLAAFICGAALSTHRRQKNHYSDKDEYEYDDPFDNWRVCKRELKPDVESNSTVSKQIKPEEDEDQSENLEFIEIIPD